MKNHAGFWQRVAASALDYIILLSYLLGIVLFSRLSNTLFGANQWLFADRIRAQVAGYLLVTLPVTLYFAICESSRRQATWGKQLMKLKVADFKGKRIRFWRAFGRTLVKFIPWELSHTLIWEIYFSPQSEVDWVTYGFVLVYLLLGLNIVSFMVTKPHQTVYDLVTNTYVLTTRQSKARIEIPLHHA